MEEQNQEQEEQTQDNVGEKEESSFTLEERYCVFKWEDIENGLPEQDRKAIERVSRKLNKYRSKKDKDPLWGVFVSSKWPEFEAVVSMLAHRIETGEPAKVTVGDVPEKQELLDRIARYQEILRLLEPIAGAAEKFDEVARGYDISSRLESVRDLLSKPETEDRHEEEDITEGEVLPPS